LAFQELEDLEELSDTVARDEDRGVQITQQLQKSNDKLTKAGVYIRYSDAELDAIMRDQINPEIEEMQETHRLNREESAR